MRILLIVLSIFLSACAGSSYNPTVFNYHYDEAALKRQPVKTLVLATVNVSGEPTRTILRDAEPRINAMVVDYLKSNGYKLAPQHLFENAWRQGIHTYGNIYDPTTGRVDRIKWQAVMASTLEALREHKEIDAVIFTDLIEHDVQHSAGMNHYARWWGVTRKPATQGAGSGVPMDFNWTQPIKAASLGVTIYAMDGTPLFSSRGGLDTLFAVNMRNPNQGFTRRSRILESQSHIREGISLAMHPFIKMRRYPGTPPQ